MKNDNSKFVKLKQRLEAVTIKFDDTNYKEYKIKLENEICNYDFTHVKDIYVIGNVSFRDCIFKDIKFHVENNSEFLVYDSLLNGQTDIYCNHIKSLTIENCEMSEINIANAKLEKLSISRSKIQFLGIGSIITDSLYIGFNSIILIHFQNIRFKNDFIFDIDQIENIKKLKDVVEVKSESKDDPIIVRGFLDTIFFLKKHSNIIYRIEDYVYIIYLERLFSQKTYFGKFMMFATGGFMYPHRIFTLAIITIIFSSFLFFITSPSENRNILDSIYLSGMSFTTIGFGDVVPQNFARGISIIEGILGNIIMASWLASIINKYTIKSN